MTHETLKHLKELMLNASQSYPQGASNPSALFSAALRNAAPELIAAAEELESCRAWLDQSDALVGVHAEGTTLSERVRLALAALNHFSLKLGEADIRIIELTALKEEKRSDIAEIERCQKVINAGLKKAIELKETK